VLMAVNGNKTQAAASLGFDRRTLHRKLKEWGES
jgi:DNA-binding protein Fis